MAANTDVINAFARLDVAKLREDGHAVAADGSQINTWENNLLAETSIPVRRIWSARLPARLRHVYRVVFSIYAL